MDRLQYYLDEILANCRWGRIEQGEHGCYDPEEIIETIEDWAKEANAEYQKLKKGDRGW